MRITRLKIYTNTCLKFVMMPADLLSKLINAKKDTNTSNVTPEY